MSHELKIKNGLYVGSKNITPETSRTVTISAGSTAAQIQAIIDSVGKYIPSDQLIVFQFADGTYTLNAKLSFKGFYGGGGIYIQGNRSESGADTLHATQAVYLDFSSVNDNGIDVSESNIYVHFYNLKIKVDSTTAANSCIYSSYLQTWVDYCYFLGTGTTQNFTSDITHGGACGVRYSRAPLGYVNLCYFDNLGAGVGIVNCSKILAVSGCAYVNNAPYYGIYLAGSCELGSCDSNITGVRAPLYCYTDSIVRKYISYTVSVDNSLTAAQINSIIGFIPKYIPNDVTITFQFADGTYNSTMTAQLAFAGFYGEGSLTVQGNAGEATTLHTNQAVILDFSAGTSSGLYFSRNSIGITVQKLSVKISDTGSIYGIFATRCKYVDCRGNYVFGAAKTAANIAIAASGTYMNCATNYVSTTNYGVYATQGSTIYSNGNDDTGTSPNYGMYADTAATIGKNGAVPAGSTSDEGTSTGGVIR